MTAFDTIDAVDGADSLGKLSQVKVPWDPEDVEYWFTELELQIELFSIKSQWVKRVILANNLPENVRSQLKDILKVQKSQLNENNKLIYKILKAKVLKLFGKKIGQNF